MYKKQVTYVSPDSTACSIANQIGNYLDISISNVKSIHELFPMISDPSYCADLILIDVEKLHDVEGANIFDVIRTLSTLIKSSLCRCTTDKVETHQRSAVIGIIASVKTDISIIKEALTLPEIKGVYPRGDVFSFDEKTSAIRDLLSNECHLPKKIGALLKAKKKVKRKEKPIITDGISLTPRQSQILQLIITRGASNKIIARTLDISESTVKLHVTAILKKYGARNRTQLAVFAKSNQLKNSTKV